MTLDMLSLVKMAFCKMILGIMTVGITILSITTLVIKDTLRNCPLTNVIWHNDTE
jgi:hypothetical protein